MEKKSLINTLKTTKKANVATAPATNEGVSTCKAARKSVLAKRAASVRLGKMNPKM